MASKTDIHMIGNAHLDPVWLWQWQEGYAEIKATFRSALDRLREFPDFVFTCAGAAYYRWVEENAPEMFEEIRERIKEGRWVVVGGWWIQPDCNLPSGESFVRHGLYSQRYFLEKFSVMARVGYNVDSFGHHGMLPQILKKSGMDAYVYMRPNEQEKSMDRSLFWWESIDGSRVMTFRIPFSYGNWASSDKHEDPFKGKVQDVMALADQDGHSFMNFYGVGNHGGGPTIANLQSIHSLQQTYGSDKIKLSSPNAYFAEMERIGAELPVFRDDLQHHASGCYSAHSETKALNRKAEHRLLTAEKFSTIAYRQLGLAYPERELRRGWENVMFNHFHDIMGGCSIKEAYEDARDSYGEALHTAAVSLNAALQKISWSIDTMKDGIQALSKDMDWALWEQKDEGIPLVVFNPLSWEVHAPIHVNKTVKGITDDQGAAVDLQVVRGSRTNRTDKYDTLFMGKIPAMGYRVYWIYKEKSFSPAPSGQLAADRNVLENDWYRLELEAHTGHIASLFDKQNGVEVFNGKAAVPVVIDEHHCDTWAHGIFEFRNEVAKFGDADIKLMEQGPLRARLRVVSRYNRSVLRQDFILYRDKPGIEVKVKLDWREEHKMLKLSFPARIADPKAAYEIPYGHIERPVNGEEEPGQQWLSVTGVHADGSLDSYGLTLVNDAKYSFDVKDNDMRMTVARGAIFADHYGDRDEECEFMDQGIQQFGYALIPHEGDWRTGDATRKAMEFNVPPVSIIETYHKGALPQSSEGIRISASHVIAAAFKRSEDDDGYILRCYETNGREEVVEIAIPMLGRTWNVPFGKYEIKTLFIPDDAEAAVREVNMLELQA
ncbi:alpha-mannosidase [Paenibacillus piri]|uniref:Alpha-mannosidase n=1 Tax=Paenibacillus piri TaxID=2547395 RepID=A0A4R5KTI7_9BACL|nr:alpha-mannosidase [Paenibacillus piri]TDF98752.1 alpha-mannosidase [Paenibacillus piri]